MGQSGIKDTRTELINGKTYEFKRIDEEGTTRVTVDHSFHGEYIKWPEVEEYIKAVSS